ncbi:(S)-coclaurine N-methyltransferase [Vitis vinifera]|uniref:(S)-coclaurine N-methyltransferase n=1 Tax=Vitis vinifera TaxID=29760 RepID=A0A438K912_VITVI|nr:(S)-coclaurine N-methyltransferase [Vitis vinifera]
MISHHNGWSLPSMEVNKAGNKQNWPRVHQKWLCMRIACAWERTGRSLREMSGGGTTLGPHPSVKPHGILSSLVSPPLASCLHLLTLLQSESERVRDGGNDAGALRRHCKAHAGFAGTQPLARRTRQETHAASLGQSASLRIQAFGGAPALLSPPLRPLTKHQDVVDKAWSWLKESRASFGSLETLEEMPIAIKTEDPKSQHYELPTSFFKLVLGKNLKYSCCYFPDKSSTLEDAENAMLEMYCKRAQKYTNCRITGICNSKTQKAYIEEQCQELQLQNVEIIVADISTLEMEATYDRIFSIEMLRWVLLFDTAHEELQGSSQEDIWWMNRIAFFLFIISATKHSHITLRTKAMMTGLPGTSSSGGTMPAANLLLYFQEDVSVVDHWLVNGKHYAQTSEEWLKRMDKNLASIKPIMESTYGKDSAVKWTVYWRTFFILLQNSLNTMMEKNGWSPFSYSKRLEVSKS